MKNKAFTLIELLGVIMILGVLVLIAFPPLLKQIKETKKGINDATKSLIIDAAKDYYEENKSNYERTEGMTYCIGIDTLIQNNNLNPKIKDHELNDIDASKQIKMIYHNDKFDYELADSCTSYTVYTVTFDSNGGSIPSNPEWDGSGSTVSKRLNSTTYGTLPTPTKSGYTFLGWKEKNYYIPSEYQEVEYIESDGNQYIDTGIESKGTIGFSIKYEIYNSFTTEENFGAVFGGRYGRQNMEIQINTYADFDTGVYRYGNTSNPALMNENTINEISYKGNEYITNGTVNNINRQTFNSGYNIYIFGVNKAGSISELSSMKLYNFKLYDGDELVRNFIPCFRKNDNVIGLYDTANKVFYTNGGTGTFDKGNNIINEYITSAHQTITNENHTLYAMWEEE